MNKATVKCPVCGNVQLDTSILPSCFYGGLKFSDIRKLIIELRKEGTSGRGILQAIKEKWPNEPDKWVSRSALYRFLERAREGRLKEFGIDKI